MWGLCASAARAPQSMNRNFCSAKVGETAVASFMQRGFIDKVNFVIADKVSNVNGNALGYVFGMLDALLQCANLDIRDIAGLRRSE